MNYTTDDFAFFKESRMLVLSSVDFTAIHDVINVLSKHTGRTLKFNLKSILEDGRILYEPVTPTPNVGTLVIYPQFLSTVYKARLGATLSNFDELYQFSDDRRSIEMGNKQKAEIKTLIKIIENVYKETV